MVEDRLVLADGTAVAPGSRALALHLWNERIPIMGPVGPTLAWARKIDRAIHASLHELACYLAAQPSLRDVAAICGDMPVRGIVQAKQLARIMARYGFEAAVGTADRRSPIHRFGDAVLVLMLVWATNPCAVRSALLRCCNIRLFVSRAALERRYISSMRAAHRASAAPPLPQALKDRADSGDDAAVRFPQPQRTRELDLHAGAAAAPVADVARMDRAVRVAEQMRLDADGRDRV